MSVTSDFVGEFLQRTTDGAMYVCSLPNRGEVGKEKHVLTRDAAEIAEFCTRWDRPKRGLFYCVSTITEGTMRRKENYCQSCFLHVDIDFKDVAITPDECVAALESARVPPSRLHLTGNGIHALWWQPRPTSDAETVEKNLRRLAVLHSGDPMVAQCVALLRMPGTHNSKGGQWSEVTLWKR